MNHLNGRAFPMMRSTGKGTLVFINAGIMFECVAFLFEEGVLQNAARYAFRGHEMKSCRGVAPNPHINN